MRDPAKRRTRLSRYAGGWVVAAVLLFSAGLARAQEEEQKGVDEGNYNIKQSIEFGGRFASIDGSTETYDTFLNLQQGPRLLGFTTEMRSLDHHATFFDRLYFSNFGYGGDPNDVSRLRLSKNKWYDFDALFRRDENVWDYSLLANPLNPTTPAFANAPAGFNPVIANSPHLFNTRRRMGDYNLLLLPQSRIRFRIGYSRNVSEGPSFSSIHQGTEQLLFQEVKDTVNAYRLGVDFRILPRTNISYDQILSYYKGDTGLTDNNQNFLLPNGAPVDLGVSFNADARQPCAGTFLPGGFVNPACSAYFSYLRHGRSRTSSPTEQLSLQSSYFANWDFSAKFSYTAGDVIVDDWSESLAGREARTNLFNQKNSGPVFGRHVSANADFGATWRMTSKLSFVDSFHFANWHNPMEFDASGCSFFTPNLLAAPQVFTPTSPLPSNLSFPCTPPGGAVTGAPVHTTSSAPDLSFSISSLFLKQDEKTNLAELDYQFSQKLGVRAGFRYRHRSINDNDFETTSELFFPDNANRGDCALIGAALPPGCTANGDGSFTFVTPDPAGDPGETLINEYSGVFGIWLRPVKGWRISFDTELMSADNSFTRISPRQTQEYRLRTTYKPAEWVNLSGSLTLWEGRNNVAQVNNLQHNRVYAFSATLQPNEKTGFELGYDYNDVFSQILICFTSSAVPTGPATVNCPVAGLVQQISTYTNQSHYGYFDTSWTPTKRLTARVGANITGTSGTVLIISPNAPSGPLDSIYVQPFGGLDYRFAKSWTGKAYWGYYGYHEDQSNVVQDVFAPRNFHANLVTLSLQYAF